MIPAKGLDLLGAPVIVVTCLLERTEGRVEFGKLVNGFNFNYRAKVFQHFGRHLLLNSVDTYQGTEFLTTTTIYLRNLDTNVYTTTIAKLKPLDSRMKVAWTTLLRRF